MTAAEYMDALQLKLGVNSDYAVARVIGVSRQAASRYRLGMGHFDDEIARKVGEILEIHPGIVMLHMYADRTRDEGIKELWKDITRGFWQVVPLANDRRRVRRMV
jgi:hypothetical protein